MSINSPVKSASYSIEMKANSETDLNNTDSRIDEKISDENKIPVCNDDCKSNGDSKESKTLSENTTENNNIAKVDSDVTQEKTTSPTPPLSCGWCHETQSILNYILPTLSGESIKFCSEICITEFRKVVKKGACKQCGNAIRSIVAPNQDFCSTICLNKSKPKNCKSVFLKLYSILLLSLATNRTYAVDFLCRR